MDNFEGIQSRKIAHQARKLTEMGKLLGKLKEDKANLEGRLKIKDINLQRASSQHDFLKQRVIQVHGKQAFVDLMNHVDNPVPFEADNFKKLNSL